MSKFKRYRAAFVDAEKARPQTAFLTEHPDESNPHLFNHVAATPITNLNKNSIGEAANIWENEGRVTGPFV